MVSLSLSSLRIFSFDNSVFTKNTTHYTATGILENSQITTVVLTENVEKGAAKTILLSLSLISLDFR